MNIDTETPRIIIAPSPRPWRDTTLIKRHDSPNFKEFILRPERAERDVKFSRPNSPIERRRSLSTDICIIEIRTDDLSSEEKEGNQTSRESSLLRSRARDRYQDSHHKCDGQARDIDAESVNHYIDMYFKHVNNVRAGSLHQEKFMYWFNNTTAKSEEDLTLIYAILAVGTLFSTRSERGIDGSLFSNIAREAMQKLPCEQSSSQLSQARTLIALHCFSCGQQTEAWALAVSGLSAAFGLSWGSNKSIWESG